MARRRSTEATPATKTPGGNGNTSKPKSTKRKRGKFDWATAEFNGFELRPIKSAKKVKPSESQTGKLAWNQASMSADILQKTPFEGTDLSPTYHRVSPELPWESTDRYRKFTIEHMTFDMDDIVFIRADPDEAGSKDAPVQGWVAKILEVRAGSPNHVYLRVCWLYRPEDLPGGRKPYHGLNELIASNDMAIIDATTVDGRANVIHWQEQKDEGEVLNPLQLFWRQTLDVTKKQPVLSALAKHCVDNVPHNPDNLLVRCDSCHKWLHGACLEKAAVREACESNGVPYPDDSTAARGRKGQKAKRKQPDPFVAQISSTSSGKTRLTVMDRRSGPGNTTSWDVPIKCLLCEAMIEDISGEDETEENGEDKAEEDGKDEAKVKSEDEASVKSEDEAMVKSEDEAKENDELASANMDLTSSDVLTSDSSDSSHTPVNRTTEEEEEEEEEEEDEDEESVVFRETSSPINQSSPTGNTSVLEDNTAEPPTNAARRATNGAGETTSPFVRFVTTGISSI